MSWVFPTSQMRTGTVLDWMDVNEQLAAYASVIDGGLSEHNFESGIGDQFAVNPDSMRDDVAIAAGSVVVEAHAFTTGDMDQVQMSEQWIAVSGSELDIVGPGGLVVITYSFQAVFNLYGDSTPGLHFAIEVDGAPRMQTLLGSGDMSNDLYNQDDVEPIQIPVESGASIKNTFAPHCVEGMFRLDAGAHTARLLVRSAYTSRSLTQPESYIGCLEGIYFHLWA